jgi:hypothetical protein
VTRPAARFFATFADFCGVFRFALLFRFGAFFVDLLAIVFAPLSRGLWVKPVQIVDNRLEARFMDSFGSRRQHAVSL